MQVITKKKEKEGKGRGEEEEEEQEEERKGYCFHNYRLLVMQNSQILLFVITYSMLMTQEVQNRLHQTDSTEPYLIVSGTE